MSRYAATRSQKPSKGTHFAYLNGKRTIVTQRIENGKVVDRRPAIVVLYYDRRKHKYWGCIHALQVDCLSVVGCDVRLGDTHAATDPKTPGLLVKTAQVFFEGKWRKLHFTGDGAEVTIHPLPVSVK